MGSVRAPFEGVENIAYNSLSVVSVGRSNGAGKKKGGGLKRAVMPVDVDGRRNKNVLTPLLFLCRFQLSRLVLRSFGPFPRYPSSV